MTRGMIIATGIALGLLAGPMTAAAADTGASAGKIVAPDAASRPYYDFSDKDGWWWYKDYTDEQQVPDEKAAPPKRIIPDMKDYTYEQLWSMHPDDFQELLMQFQKKAVMTLKPEDAKDYYIMQDIARRKSLGFANLAQYVMQTSPELSVDSAIPLASPGRAADVRVRQEEIEDRIARSVDSFAMIYFYSPTCHFCREQDGIMHYFVRKYGWEVKKIDITKETATASRFNVQTTPYIILVYRHSQDFIPVTVGVASLGEIEDRVYRGMRLLSGEVTPDNYSLYEYQRGGPLDVSGKQAPSVRRKQ